MNSDLKVLRDKRIHPVVDHDHRAVDGVIHGEVEYGAEEILVFAEIFDPGFERQRPFLAILFEVALAVE